MYVIPSLPFAEVLMTITDESLKTYRSQIRNLINKYGAGKDPVSHHDYLLMYKKIASADLATNTVKSYRQIMYWHANVSGVEINKEEFRLTQKVKKSRKMKRYDCSDRALMIASIQEIPEIYREFIVKHLLVGGLIGYRLAELPSIVIDNVEDSRFTVKIRNGKHTNGRSFAEVRVFSPPRMFANLDVYELLAWLISFSKKMDHDEFLKFLNRASNAHSRLARKVLKRSSKLPTLSSTRHQMKMVAAASKDSLDISVLFGHVSEDTQKENYGISRGGVSHVSEAEAEYSRDIMIPEFQRDMVRRTKDSLANFIKSKIQKI